MRLVSRQSLSASDAYVERIAKRGGGPLSVRINGPPCDNEAFYSCAISYATQDEGFVRRLRSALLHAGVPCWFAPEDLPIGACIRSEIDAAIRRHDKLLVVISKNSIRSLWVEKEVATAFEEEVRRGTSVVFPIQLDDMPGEYMNGWAGDIKRMRNVGDFRQWKDEEEYRKALNRILHDLKIEKA